MFSTLAKRAVYVLLTLWVVSILVFVGTEVLPGDVASALLGQGATPETLAALREKLELNRPAVVRYGMWISKFVRGDWGTSLATGRSISKLVLERVRNTFLLAIMTAAFAVPLSLFLGLLSATYPDSLIDRSISVSSLVMISVPEFFTGALLVLLFAITWRVFPAIVYTSRFGSFGEMLRGLTLPILTLTAIMLAHMARMTRAAVLDILRSSYVEMAILKGVPKRRIILRHALPNAIGPVLNVIAINLGYLVSGVVIVEVIFSFPGLGRMMVDSVTNRDVPLVQAVAMVFCAVYVGLNLMADILVIVTNPRLRKTKT